MAAIGLIALRDFTFQGIARHEGERFDVKPVEAAMLTYQKKARFLTTADQVATDETPRPPLQPPARARRTYRRRDLTAETTAAIDETSTD